MVLILRLGQQRELLLLHWSLNLWHKHSSVGDQGQRGAK